VLNFEREYLSARQPRLGFASPNATPLTRAARKVTRTYRVLINKWDDTKTLDSLKHVKILQGKLFF